MTSIHDDKALNKRPYEVSPMVMAKVREWIARGDLVLVYENAELGPNVGHLVFMPHDNVPEIDYASQLGSRAPDTPSFIGWRYRLVSITDQEADFVAT